MFHFQTQLIRDSNNPEQTDQAPVAPGLNRGLPVQENGHQQGHASLVQELNSNLHLEENFGGEVIAVLEDDTGQIEELIITFESTPAIVEKLN